MDQRLPGATRAGVDRLPATINSRGTTPVAVEIQTEELPTAGSGAPAGSNARLPQSSTSVSAKNAFQIAGRKIAGTPIVEITIRIRSSSGNRSPPNRRNASTAAA